MAKDSTNKYTFSVGRRRSAVCTVRLFTGKGNHEVNTKPVEKVYSMATHQVAYQKPFEITDTKDKFHFKAKVNGGGIEGQVDALVLAISRALVKVNETEYKPLLRQAGLLTVDARVRERRKVGTGGKARRAKQSPKR